MWQISQSSQAHTDELQGLSSKAAEAWEAARQAQEKSDRAQLDKEREVAEMRRALDQAISQLQVRQRGTTDTFGPALAAVAWSTRTTVGLIQRSGCPSQASDQDVVDRKLITNLIVAYHSRRRPREVLDLMARILNFSEEEKRQVGLVGRGLGISKLLGNVFTPLPAPELPPDKACAVTRGLRSACG